jgi:hypothetical protein
MASVLDIGGMNSSVLQMVLGMSVFKVCAEKEMLRVALHRLSATGRQWGGCKGSGNVAVRLNAGHRSYAGE